MSPSTLSQEIPCALQKLKGDYLVQSSPMTTNPTNIKSKTPCLTLLIAPDIVAVLPALRGQQIILGPSLTVNTTLLPYSRMQSSMINVDVTLQEDNT